MSNARQSLLFVYGSLKRGFGNHHFLRGQTFLGEAVTEPDYRLVDIGGFPGLVETEAEAGRAIRGELWSVQECCLRALDWLEEVDAGLYRRGNIRLQGRDGSVLTYLFAGEASRLPEAGEDWPRERDVGPASPFPSGFSEAQD